MGLASDLLKQYEHLIEAITLVPSDDGRFEVSVNGKLIYSKLETKRHANAGEIVGLVNKMTQNN